MKEEEIIKILTQEGKTISAMESCTGGGLANRITNYSGSSEIIKFSSVTYSNEYKIKMGVPKEVIDKYSVYSLETAISMAKAIADFSDSNYGIGITGKLNRIDPHNPEESVNTVYICIYDKDENINYTYILKVNKLTRKENKDEVIDFVIDNLCKIIKREL